MKKVYADVLRNIIRHIDKIPTIDDITEVLSPLRSLTTAEKMEFTYVHGIASALHTKPTDYRLHMIKYFDKKGYR